MGVGRKVGHWVGGPARTCKGRQVGRWVGRQEGQQKRAVGR